MNYSKWIGATVRHASGNRLKIHQLSISPTGEVIFVDTNGVHGNLSDCKRIRIVKRKRSQVILDALETIESYSRADAFIRKTARIALVKYREKEAKK